MFKYRMISFPLLIALAAVIFLFPAAGFWIYLVLATAALGFALYEASAMLNNSNVLKCSPKSVGIFAALFTFFTILHFYKPFYQPFVWIALVFLVFLLCLMPAYFLIRRGELERIFGSAGVFLVLFLPLLIAVLHFNTKISPRLILSLHVKQIAGVSALLFLIAVSKSMDTGGYIFGMLTSKLPKGNHKIAPSISPKKSWEGFFGGLLLSIIAALMFHWFGDVKLCFCIVSGIVLGVGSFFGDLTESALKRRCNIKDSGSYIPGMGGALDVLDSFIYNGVLLMILLAFYKF